MKSVLHCTLPARLMRSGLLPRLRPQLAPIHSASLGVRSQLPASSSSSSCWKLKLVQTSSYTLHCHRIDRVLGHICGHTDQVPLILTATANGATRCLQTMEGQEEDAAGSSNEKTSSFEGDKLHLGHSKGQLSLDTSSTLESKIVRTSTPEEKSAEGRVELDIRESLLEGESLSFKAENTDRLVGSDEGGVVNLSKPEWQESSARGGADVNTFSETSQDVGDFVEGGGWVENWKGEDDCSDEDEDEEHLSKRKPLCFYFTQGCCNKMDDPDHTSRFSHDWSTGPWSCRVQARDLRKLRPQKFDYFLVLDLEGQVEILEFPVVMVEAATLQVVDRFHRFVRPVKMPEERLNDYIFNKYSRWYLDSTWHATAKPFTEVIQDFDKWLVGHGLWTPGSNSRLKRAAFVTCGNWDVKTKIPEQCVDSNMHLPAYFMEWINIKDIYLNYYKKRAGGMIAMMKGQHLRIKGRHHVGLDDTHNITRVLQRMLSHGVVMKLTATKDMRKPDKVKFLFWNRVR